MVPDRDRPVTTVARMRVPTTSRTIRVRTTRPTVPRLTPSSVRGRAASRTWWGMGNAAQQGDVGCTSQDQVSRNISSCEIEERGKKGKEWAGRRMGRLIVERGKEREWGRGTGGREAPRVGLSCPTTSQPVEGRGAGKVVHSRGGGRTGGQASMVRVKLKTGSRGKYKAKPAAGRGEGLERHLAAQS